MLPDRVSNPGPLTYEFFKSRPPVGRASSASEVNNNSENLSVKMAENMKIYPYTLILQKV